MNDPDLIKSQIDKLEAEKLKLEQLKLTDIIKIQVGGGVPYQEFIGNIDNAFAAKYRPVPLYETRYTPAVYRYDEKPEYQNQINAINQMLSNLKTQLTEAIIINTEKLNKQTSIILPNELNQLGESTKKLSPILLIGGALIIGAIVLKK